MNDEGETNLELVAKLQDQFDKIGVSLTGVDGQMRSSYDILYDLNSVWGTLDKNTRLYIAELVSGKNQVDVFNATLQNFGSVIAATETAINSAGSATRENEAYMDGLEAAVSKIRQSFQELSTALIDDEAASFVLNIANSLIQLVNTDIGRFLAIGTAVTTTTVAVASLWRVMEVGKTVSNLFAGGAKLATAGLAGLNLPLIAAIAGFTALVAFAPQIIEFFDRLSDPIGHTTKKLEENVVELETSKAQLKELEQIPWYDRSDEINNEIDTLKDYIATLELANEKLITKRAKEAFKAVTDTRDETTPMWSVINPYASYGVPALYTEEDALKHIKDEYGEIYSSIVEATEAGHIFAESFVVQSISAEEYYQKLIDEQTEANKKVAEGHVLVGDELVQWQKRDKELRKFVTNAELAENHTKDLSDVMLDQVEVAKDLAKEQESIIDNLREQDRVQNLVSSGMKISKEDADDLLASNATLKDKIGELNGAYYIEVQALYDLAEAGNLAARQTIENQKEMTKAAIEGTQQRLEALLIEAKSYSSMAGNISAGAYMTPEMVLLLELADYQKQLTELEGIIGSWTSPTPDITDSSGKTSSVLEAFKEQMTQLQHEIFLLTQNDAEANADAIVAIYKKMQESVAKKATELRGLGYEGTSKEIRELQTMWWGYSDEIKKVYDKIAETEKKFFEDAQSALKSHLEEQAKEYQKQADEQQKLAEVATDEAVAYKIYAQFVKDTIDEQIAGYQAEIDALQKANDEREKEIALQERLNNLAKAKNTQVMVFKDGRFQYTNDIDAISSAQGELSEYKREQQLAKEKQYWQDKIDELETYKDEWNNFTSDYERNANLQILIQSNLFTTEDLIFSNRIKSVETFALKYESAMNRAVEANKQMELLLTASSNASTRASEIGSATGQQDWSKWWWDADNAYKDGRLTKEQADDIKKFAHTQKANEMADKGYDYSHYNPNTGSWNIERGYASGTLSATQGISLVGEKGPEARILNAGDSIFSNEMTKNLWRFASNPYAFMSKTLMGLSGKTEPSSTTYNFGFDKLQLNGVKDVNGLIEGLKRAAHQYSTQRS